MVHQKGTQSPGEAQPQQDVKDIAAYRVGHRHVPHAWEERGRKYNEIGRKTCKDSSDLSAIYLVELQSGLPCSRVHWFLLPGRLYP